MDTNNFKKKLEAELAQLEGELQSTGKLVNAQTGDWEGVAPEMDTATPQAEKNEAADKIEELEANHGITENLETRWKEVQGALKKIEGGGYGLCEVDNAPIEMDRLEANPAARTCIAHM